MHILHSFNLYIKNLHRNVCAYVCIACKQTMTAQIQIKNCTDFWISFNLSESNMEKILPENR